MPFKRFCFSKFLQGGVATKCQTAFFCFSFLFVSGGSGSRYRHFFQLIDNPDIVIIREYKFFCVEAKVLTIRQSSSSATEPILKCLLKIGLFYHSLFLLVKICIICSKLMGFEPRNLNARNDSYTNRAMSTGNDGSDHRSVPIG